MARINLFGHFFDDERFAVGSPGRDSTLGAPSNAWAYVDPGMGSYVFQLTMAAMLAGVYTFRRYLHAVLMFVRSRMRRERNDRDDAPRV
jgi:hypothetical protein